MEVKTVLQEAVSRRQNALSEFDGKKILAAYGIPVSREYLVSTADEAVQMAVKIGFPVVLKACSTRLPIKPKGGWWKCLWAVKGRS